MLQRILCLCLLSISFLSASQTAIDPNQTAVTYDDPVGRFGNKMIAYMHAKWISYKYDIPLLYVPFTYSEHFKLHEKERFLRRDYGKQFTNKLELSDISQMQVLPPSTLVKIPYFRSEGPIAGIVWKLLFKPDWNDPGFRKMMQEHLAPSHPVQTLHLPKNRINVLLHVRTGANFDPDEIKLILPFKFPPHIFYIQSLEKLSTLLNHPPIYAHIMTDDTHPAHIAELYRTSLAHLKNVKIGFREGVSGYTCNVMEDFFSIPKFDCVIRGDSTFAITAGLFADYLAVIVPKVCHVENETIFVDEMDIQINQQHPYFLHSHRTRR